MIGQGVRDSLLKFVPEEDLFYNEPLCTHTTFRIGGPADCLVEISSKEQLSRLLNYLGKVGLPWFVLGNGSNLLVSDEGYKGIMLHIGDKMNTVTVLGNKIIAGAGASMAKVAREAMKAGLTGMEFAAGIPGTVGGGVIMNAGAYDGEMKQVTELVRVLDKNGEELELDPQSMAFGYRTSAIKGRPFVVTECVFVLEPGDPAEISAKMADFGERRRSKQPLELPSAGSTFKRPEGHFAGKLIQDAGFSGYHVGDAAVSSKHCGFVVNEGHATAADVRELIRRIQEQVKADTGVTLEPEVIFVGKM